MEPIEPLPGSVAHDEVEAAVGFARRVEDNIRRAVKVRDDVLRHVVVALLAEGHILVEDYPGVGKTALARALSRTLDCQFARVQCTADLLPADIVGANIYNQREQRFEFRPGPIFANIVLVDEINRASPKTQSGLLECMQERHVTVDVHSHELATPFMVFATQNPVEYEGTYPLPEAQVDRFMVRLSLGYPSPEDEAGMLAGHEAGDRVLDLEPVVDHDDVLERAGRRAPRARLARAARLRRRAAAPHPRRLARRARRVAARRPDAAARGEGERAAQRPRPRAARRRAGAGAGRAVAPDHARARGRGRRARRGRRRGHRGDAGALGGAGVRSALGCAALGLLLLLVAGTFDAEPLYVTGAALALLGAGAAGWIGLGAWGAAIHRTIAKRSVIEEEPLPVRIEATRGRLPLPPGWIDEPLLPEPVRLSAGRSRARVRVDVTFARRGRRVLAPPALVLRDPFGLAQRVLSGPHADEVLVLPRVAAGARDRHRRRGRSRRTRAPRSSPPPRPRSTACASTARARRRRGSTGRPSPAATG